MTRLGPLQPLDEPAWAAALDAYPDATAFHDFAFLELAATVLGARFVPLGATCGTLTALVPLIERRRGPLTTLNWVPFPYLGPLADPPVLPAVLQALAGEARRRRAALVQVGFARPSPHAARDLDGAGLQVREHPTLVVPTAGRTREALWDGLRQNGRRDVRRASAAGLTVRGADEHDLTQELPAMLRRLEAHGAGAGWPPAATGHAVWARFAGAPHVRMTAAVDRDGATQAVTVALRQADRLYLWLGAAHRMEGADPHALLYWDALCHAADEGLTDVDLVGTPTPGIDAYKRKFGPVEAPVLVARRQRMPGYEALQRAHRRVAAVGRSGVA